MSSRTYKDAIHCLNSLQSTASALASLHASGERANHRSMPEMVEHLRTIGYEAEDLNKLNVIHITGTKGKGSTCAFTDSILRHARPHWKIGLYTSPHMVSVRERIRINGAPLSEEDFAKYFFEVFEKVDKGDLLQRRQDEVAKLNYFRALTLIAFHTFMSLKVDAVVLEVGVGGTYDSTNVVPRPIATGVTSLGMDHVTVLGDTLQLIAWQKGGISKPGVPALTVAQPDDAMHALHKRAEECGASSFTVVYPLSTLSEVKLGIAGAHQVSNASLAVHLASILLRHPQHDQTLPEAFIRGLTNTRWPGRCQTVVDPVQPTTTWFLDGAHTVDSLECCMEWFVSPDVAFRTQPQSRSLTRILIFNLSGARSGSKLIAALITKATAQLKQHNLRDDPVSLFDHVIFCTNVTYIQGSAPELTSHAIDPSDIANLRIQRELSSTWASLLPGFPATNRHVLPSIEHAVSAVRGIANAEKGQIDVLVTGSLHLVGGVIEAAGLTRVAL